MAACRLLRVHSSHSIHELQFNRPCSISHIKRKNSADFNCLFKVKIAHKPSLIVFSKSEVNSEPSVVKDNEFIDYDIDLNNKKDVNNRNDINDYWDWTRTTACPVAYSSLLFSVLLIPLLPKFQFSAPFYFLFLSTWAIYVGSHRSLIRKEAQEITVEKSWLVPVFASISLFSFYSLLRFFPELNIRFFLSSYLNLVGFLAVGNNLIDPFSSLFPSLNGIKYEFDLPQWALSSESKSTSIEISLNNIFAYTVGLFFVLLSWNADVAFTVNNFIAVCIVTELLQLVSLNSFLTSVIMLCGLLIYDVFWVFGSSPVFGDNVMVTVATSNAFDGPIKLIFPTWNPSSPSPYSILGLGDLAAPGLLIALMLRFDRYLYQLKLPSSPLSPLESQSQNQSQSENALLEQTSESGAPSLTSLDFGEESIKFSPAKTYFGAAMVSYVIGLVLTIVINGYTGAAQPALLYLVPSLLFGIIATSIFKKEFQILNQFRDKIN